MKLLKNASLLCVLAILAGCATVAPQPPVGFNNQLSSETVIATAISDVPKVQITYPGASCLLCWGAAALANGGVADEVGKLTNEDLAELGDSLVSKLKDKGLNVKELESTWKPMKLKKNEPVSENEARKDYRPLKETLDASHLLVMNFNYVGVKRDYSSYVPTSEPYAIVEGLAYLVNLTTNIYEWYLPIYQRHSPGLEWKDPPSYPGVINAYYQAIETTKDEILSSIVTEAVPSVASKED